MCVAAIAWQASERYRLVAVGNRDEFHERPTAPLGTWDDDSGIIAGRDLRAGGTWLGVSGAGRFALLTNFRDPEKVRPDAPSRGRLVQQCLSGEEVEGLARMNPCNLFHVERDAAFFLSNHPEIVRQRMSAGIHGVSNGPFERPWPKTRQLCDALEGWLDNPDAGRGALFASLRREAPEPDECLTADTPQPQYAPVFIRNEVYGTRCSTVVTVDQQGRGVITERSFDPSGAVTGTHEVAFSWPVA